MRGIIATVGLVMCLLPHAALAQDQNAFIEGFGGLRVSGVPNTMTPSFGGAAGAGLTPNLQVVGEFGRMGDVLPATIDSLLALTPVDFRVSALYGEGGVRFISNPHSAVRAYGETLAGFAKLHNELGGIGTGSALVDLGLRYFDQTDPIAALGAGVILQGGPVIANIGYRFSRVFASDAFGGLLTSGNLDVNEVRFGVGIRF